MVTAASSSAHVTVNSNALKLPAQAPRVASIDVLRGLAMVLTSRSPFQIAAFDRPSGLMALFPLSLIPVYMVPLSILLHLASLRSLRNAEQTPATGRVAEAYQT